MPFLPATKNDLRVGLFIKIARNWFSHPFSKNAFKITNEKDLATLRSLPKLKILYDPEQSDSLPPVEPKDDIVEDEQASIDPPPPPNDVSSETPRQSRHEMYEERREKLKEAEKAYQKVLTQNKTALREVKAGYAMGMSKAEDLVTNLGELIQDGTLVSLMDLMGTNEKGDEFQCHSLNVCMLSMVMGQGLDLSQKDIKMLGLGALYHDMGELAGTRSSVQSGNRSGALMSQALQRIRNEHPQNGRKMLETGFGFSQPSLQIIEQHHERLNGTGFPYGLKESAIHKLSKIVMIADIYDELCNNPMLEKCLTPHEALCLIYGKRQKDFCEEAVTVFIQTLGIYPPSSLVELSDGSIGVVCSINKLDRMRPTVMPYDPDLSRGEAKILDLTMEQDLAITQSLRPKNIPTQIWEYLNPRGMINYFAYSEEPTPTSAIQKDQEPQALPTGA